MIRASLLSTALVALALAGCGSSGDDSIASTPHTQPDASGQDVGAAGNAGDGSVGSDSLIDVVFNPDTGPKCTPVSATETKCDGIDDDCNGRVDDVDVQKDGICDCLSIGILGVSGPNPSSNFEQWLTQKGTSVTRIQTGAADTLTAAQLAGLDVVILDELMHDYQPAEAAALQSWVQDGGGLVSMTGHTGSAAVDFRQNVLLAPLGLAYGGGLLSGPVTTFQAHPTTTGLTSVTFLGGYVVSEVNAPAAKRTPIASLAAGNVGFAAELGAGKAFVWGDEWIEYDSEWSKLPEIKQLWVNILQWVGPQEKCVLNGPK